MADISDNGVFNSNLANIASANYGPTATTNNANTQANTQVQQQEAVAKSQQNQILAARMPMILAGMHDDTVASQRAGSDAAGTADASGTSPSDPTGKTKSGDTTPGQSVAAEDKSAVAPNKNFYQPALIDGAYRTHFFVQQWTQQERDALNKSFSVDPTDQYGQGPKRVMALHDARVQSETQESEQGARDEFDKMSAVSDADPGQALNILRASHPETYDAIKKQFAKDPDEDRDEDGAARLFAAHSAGAVHQYTGRKAVKGDDGVYRDEATGISIPGVEKVGLSTKEYIDLAQKAILPSVDMPDGNGGSIKVAPWRAAQMGGAKNINSPGDWVMVQASQKGLPGAASTLSPNSAPKQEARAVAQKAVDTATAKHAAAPDVNPSGTPKSVGGVGTARNAQGNVDPKLTEALHDTDFDYKPTNNGQPYTPQIGHTPPPAVQDDMQKQTAARNDLAKTSSQGVQASSAALTMYKAAQDVLDKGNYNGGAWNQELAKYSKWLPAGWQNHMTGDYQEIAKYLGNAALQAGKGIFSQMTEKESDAVMHDLNPSPGMDPDALRTMIARGAKTAQYSLDSAQRIPAYLHGTKDANQFSTWNQRHYPMETETAPDPAKPNAGVNPPKYNDAQVRAYMQKYGLKDEQATRKMLGT